MSDFRILKTEQSPKKSAKGLIHNDFSRSSHTQVLMQTSNADFQMKKLIAKGERSLIAGLKYDRQRTGLINRLQKFYGNAFVQRLINSSIIQAKLSISQPGDQYEQEADKIAEIVTRSSSPDLKRQEIPEEEELLQGKFIQRQEIEEEEIQAKLIQRVQNDDLEKQINSARGNGSSLAPSVRDDYNSKFGYDFSNVTIHTDSEADKLSCRIGAEAFTTGRDIFFKEGNFQPDSENGGKLLAHELTHVIQQNG